MAKRDIGLGREQKDDSDRHQFSDEELSLQVEDAVNRFKKKIGKLADE